MDIYMKNFAKRENSTAFPTFTSANKFECYIKDSTSVLNPTIQIKLSSGDPSTLNYAYIQDFERYYWINDWSWEGGVWNASLSCDPLASWKNEIGNEYLYVSRADVPVSIADGSAYSDGYYSTTFDGYTRNYITLDVPFEQSFNNGSYVIGIQAGGTNGVGSIKYFAMSAVNFTLFCNRLTDVQTWKDFGGWSNAVMYQMNPMQYISSVMWYPFSVTNLPVSGTAITTGKINVGWWQLDIDATFQYYKLNNSAYVWSYYNKDISTYQKHPQAQSRGKYLKFAPYTKYSLFIPPFGTYQLPSEIIGSANNFSYEIFVECINGQATMLLGTGLNTLTHHVTGQYMDLHCQIGVPIQISQITQDLAGAVLKTASAIPSALTGNFMNTAGSCIDAVSALLPSVETKGNNGSLLDYLNAPFLECESAIIASDASEHVGRVLNQNYLISNLAKNIFNTAYYNNYPNSGYIKVLDADISIACTSNELTQIKSYLEGGFFYE